MCTAFTIKTKDIYFGRNMDISYNFGEKVIIIPRNYELNFKCEKTLKNHYSMIGMGTIIDNYPLYAEATNEKGLSIAGLNFEGYASYNDTIKENKINIAPYEIIPYLLSTCANLEDVYKVIAKLNIVNIAFNKTTPLVQLHFIVAHNNKSIVIESLMNKLVVYDNPTNVLTNNPPFDYHMNNLSNYFHLSAKNYENNLETSVNLLNFGAGCGAIGLPGDFSSPSRFVRTLFLKNNIVKEEDETKAVNQFFRILDNVSMIKGVVKLENDMLDYTIYSSCINASKMIYYYRTYENNQVNSIKLDSVNIEDNKLFIFELEK